MSTAHHPERLLLDPAILEYVLLPIVGVMVLVGLLRHYVMALIQTEKVATLDSIRDNQLLSHARTLRASGGLVPFSSFDARRAHLTAKGTGALRRRKGAAAPLNPMMDPDQMANMMKGNLGMMIPNIVIMGWVSLMFSGFVLIATPFPLTLRFKGMLQRGIDVNDLDVTYVSSLSWYFLCMFGLRGVFSLILGDNTVDDAELMQRQMTMGLGSGPGADIAKMFKTERDNLSLARHTYIMGAAEKLLLDRERQRG
jgi:hypothetical protein